MNYNYLPVLKKQFHIYIETNNYLHFISYSPQETVNNQ